MAHKDEFSNSTSRVLNAWLIPSVCEVCRKRPVATKVVEFIFACKTCAEKIKTAVRALKGGPGALASSNTASKEEHGREKH